MKQISAIPRRGLAGLLAVNAALIGILAMVTFMSTANAQGFRAHGSYISATGTVPGVDSGVIYVVDETNQQLIALTYNPNTKRLDGVGARDLAADTIQFAPGRN